MVGSIRIRRKFKTGDGRFITVSQRSGTTSKKEARHINTVLDALFSRGRLDILRSLENGTLGLMQVRDAFDSQQLDSLPSAQTIKPLREHLFEWLDRYDIAENTRTGYRNCFNQLLKSGPSVPVVSDLPDMLDTMAAKYSKKPRAFNLTRSAVQAYVRSTLKRNNPLYLAVGAVEPLKVTKKRAGNPLAVSDVLDLLIKLPDELGKLFWSMCVTGMNCKEYAGRWEIDGETVVIHGTKRVARDREVPRIADGILSPASLFGPQAIPENVRQVSWYKPLRKALRKASKRSIQPHDARRTFARWMEEAGLWESHRDAYMGHGKTIRTLYSTPRVRDEMLEADRQRLVTYLKAETEKYHAERKKGMKLHKQA